MLLPLPTYTPVSLIAAFSTNRNPSHITSSRWARAATNAHNGRRRALIRAVAASKRRCLTASAAWYAHTLTLCLSYFVPVSLSLSFCVCAYICLFLSLFRYLSLSLRIGVQLLSSGCTSPPLASYKPTPLLSTVSLASASNLHTANLSRTFTLLICSNQSLTSANLLSSTPRYCITACCCLTPRHFLHFYKA